MSDPERTDKAPGNAFEAQEPVLTGEVRGSRELVLRHRNRSDELLNRAGRQVDLSQMVH